MHQITTNEQDISQSTEGTSPLPVFCLSESDLEWTITQLSEIEKLFSTDHYLATGITFSHIFPLKSLTGEIIMVKKTRFVDPKKCFEDHVSAAQELIKRGIRNFNPTYLLGNYLIQKGIYHDPSLSHERIRQETSRFIHELDSLGVMLDSPDDNIFITVNGPCIIDVTSCSFSKLRQ